MEEKMYLQNSCCFLLLLQSEPYETVKIIIESIHQFINKSFSDPQKYTRVLCVIGDDNSISAEEIATLPGVEILMWEPGEFDLGEPEITAMLSTAIGNTHEEIFILIEPGSPITGTGFDSLSLSIQAVSDDHKQFIISHRGDSESLPNSGIFNRSATQYRILLTAAEGMPIIIKKPMFGDIKFERDLNFLDFPELNVTWLISALAFEYQNDLNKVGLKLKFNLWT
jgi:hypothetical protein